MVAATPTCPQGNLANKKSPTPRNLQKAPGPYGGPKWLAFSYERGTSAGTPVPRGESHRGASVLGPVTQDYRGTSLMRSPPPLLGLP